MRYRLRIHPRAHARSELRRRLNLQERVDLAIKWFAVQSPVAVVFNHCRCSLIRCRATKSRDLTVPSGMPSNRATDAKSCPSMVASRTTLRSFSGNASIACQSTCARSSVTIASVEDGRRTRSCSISLMDLRRSPRRRSSAVRQTVRTSQLLKRSGSRSCRNF